MTRYVILCKGLFVAATQADTRHVSFTDQAEDAGEWVTYERTVKAARLVQEITGEPTLISERKTEDRPRSWAAVTE
jgi:hypothetical protein